jgi:ABC-2 type transport system permease protein
MSAPQGAEAKAAVSSDRALRRLFLTLFLRGRSSRGLCKESTPKSVGTKLALTLVIYAAVGLLVAIFPGRSVFGFALFLHGMTLALLGMFVAASAGEVLFNKEEADILLHRPVTPRSLLRAKVSVLVEVSLWLAGAFNLVGFFSGVRTKDGGWLFPPVHAMSAALEALFCTGCVVLAYELCLRWFGRERLDNLMTTVQVIVAIGAMLAGQIVPHALVRLGDKLNFGADLWWFGALPPAWFAGFDDALAGSGNRGAWILGAIGVTATATVLWLAFGKLASHYEMGLQSLGETSAALAGRGAGRRWVAAMVHAAPLRWWLRDPVTRASFLLTASYLVRDRDVKLRIYPGVAPMMAMPIVFLFQDRGAGGGLGGFGVAFTGAYLGLIPLFALNLLQYSQNWQAADVLRLAPMPGPALICDGARRAVWCFLVLPAVVGFGLLTWCVRSESSQLPLLLPGIIALPIYALFPHLGGKAVPLSISSDDAKNTARGLTMMGVMFVSMALAGFATWAWSAGWFRWLLLIEAIVAVALYAPMRASIKAGRWQSME